MHMTNEDHSHCGACGGHEHGHAHEHTHEHTHGDVTHSHPHCHEGEHQHTHEHGETPKDKDEAVLAYMLDHNQHHAQELSVIAKHFHELGKDEVAVQIEKAVEDFQKGNMRLSIALSLVK